MLRWSLPLALVLIAFVPAPLLAQPRAIAGAELKDYIRANYTKYEYQIPMRDGAKLFTAVYVPKDDSRTYPIMLIRTPYSVCAAFTVRAASSGMMVPGKSNCANRIIVSALVGPIAFRMSHSARDQIWPS